VAKKWGVLQ
jgi:hypothetical protein